MWIGDGLDDRLEIGQDLVQKVQFQDREVQATPPVLQGLSLGLKLFDLGGDGFDPPTAGLALHGPGYEGCEVQVKGRSGLSELSINPPDLSLDTGLLGSELFLRLLSDGGKQGLVREDGLDLR